MGTEGVVKARRLRKPTGEPVTVYGPQCARGTYLRVDPAESPYIPDERVIRPLSPRKFGARYTSDDGAQVSIAKDLGLLTSRPDAYRELVSMGVFSPTTMTTCWCGLDMNHDWPGKLDGEAHPR